MQGNNVTARKGIIGRRRVRNGNIAKVPQQKKRNREDSRERLTLHLNFYILVYSTVIQ